jgi:hypothetical protein
MADAETPKKAPKKAAPSPAKDVPPYACVEFGVPNGRTFTDGVESVESRRAFFQIRGIGDLEHVNYCREHKGYALLGVHNLHMIKRSPDRDEKEDQPEVIARKLNALINPPESSFAD